VRICFRIGAVEHCYYIPIFVFPITFHKPGPGPVNYPAFILDATVIASIHEAAQHVSDERVRVALQGGVEAAMSALKERAGDHAEVHLEERSA